jgi:DNA-binding NarL/FixJ family response regulator
MGEKQRIIIAEDHTILREGLRALISSDPEFDVVGEAGDGREAIRYVEKLVPDLILLDLSMPRMNGMEAIKEIKKQCPETKILVGYVLKDATHTELLMAIKSVLTGKPYLSPGVSERVIEGYLEGRKTLRSESPWDTLTQREREVLKLIAEGYKNKEIADYLYISAKTVEKHRANLMKKLDLHNTSALTAYAMEKGLVTR